MPNIAGVLKAEITRLARKEVREVGDGLKKSTASHRAEIASLKRRVQALEGLVKQLMKTPRPDRPRARAAAPDAQGESPASGQRFSAKGLAANRKRLGLSAADFALLAGTTGQSIYAWETGKSRPRPQAIEAIAGLRGIGKRQAAEKLAELRSSSTR